MLDLHENLSMETLDGTINNYVSTHEERLHQHVTIEVIQLFEITRVLRTLKQQRLFNYLFYCNY